ncbi:ubiquitin-like small modifier protein 1 [Halomicrococcus gelatinilyticus]|uniref:ubiquitin-like small modifier protein 1 n=1 Tax=Halomicrococcus gelatinilyticus TaxID=1702103 RepID=UPI002E1675A5
MQVTVYGPLRSATGAKRVPVAFDGGTVSDALAAFVDAYPRARQHLYSDDGSLRPSVRLSVDGQRVDVETKCPPDADLTVVPAVQGGAT